MRLRNAECEMRNHISGYSLIEMVVTMAIFGIFLLVLVGLQREFLKFDHEMRVEFFTNPAPYSVLARLRRDVLDSRGYPEEAGEFKQSSQTLLLDTVSEAGKNRVVVWDFAAPSLVRRIELEGGNRVAAWEARAVPAYSIESWEAPGDRFGVLIKAMDHEGNVVVDQIVTPRAR